MQKTTAQSQQESQKTRERLCFENHAKKKEHAHNVARPRQRNIYQITSPTTCNLHTDKQTNFV